MSQFVGFIQKVSTDPQLAGQMIKLGRAGEAEFVSGVMTLGATHGFSFPEPEVREMFSDLKADNMLADKLTDDELEAVAGGGGNRNRAMVGAKGSIAKAAIEGLVWFFMWLGSIG